MKSNSNNKNLEEEEDPDKHYLGNIWGWKFSYIGLGIILFFLAIAIYRAKSLGIPLDKIGTESEPLESIK